MGKDHECTEVYNKGSLYLLVCPLCDQKIRIDISDDENEIFRLHEASGTCNAERKKEKVYVSCIAKSCKVKLTEYNS